MADLDSLNIRLTASAGDATKAIDSIIGALTKLNGALNNFGADSKYMKGLNNLSSGLKSVRISLNGLDSGKIQEVAKALDKLSSASAKLASLTGIAPKVDTQAMDKVVAASDKAIAKAKEIGSSWNFGDDKAVNELAEAIEKLYASVGDDDAVRASMTQIENLIETYSRFENELHEVAKAENEALRSTHGRLTSDWQDVLGGDYETARRNRGKLGIGNTSKRGGSAGEIIGENSQLGIEESINESENLALALERLEKNAYNAAHEMVGFHEASVSLTGGIEAVQAEVDDLVNSLGLAADKLREVNSSMGDDFMNIDTSGVDDIFGDPAESIERLRNSAQQAAPVVEQLGTAEQRVADSAQQVQTVGNIFEGISQGLTSLQGITLSDSLKNIESVSKALGTFGGKYAGSAAENLRNVAEALRGFNVQIPDYGESLTNFANGLSKLGGKKISDAFDILIRLKVAIESFNSLKIDPAVTASIEQLGTGLYRFGLAKMDKAVNNLPALAQGMSALIQSLANMPAVSENTIRLVTALGNMNVSGSQLSNTVNSLGTGLRRYRGHALNAHKASMSLASAFGKMYANFFIFFRLIRRFGKDITLASDLTEVQNVVDVTFADMADKMNDFSKSAIEALGMSELTAKQIGSKFQAMGSAMGISDSMVKSTNDFVQKATKGYADVANSMGDVSINLTRLAGDMASFYNQDYADVAEKLQAIFTGQTRPLRAYGLDLTQATLKEWALKNGMDANIKTMTQAEKTLLRYQYVMANTTAAHGDFIRTQDTWANSLRIASEKLNQLRIILGKIAIYSFKPLVQSFNSAMNQILKGAEGLLNALGKIFGWQVEWSDAGVLGEESDDAGELADNMGDAADNAKKFKNFLLGIDELNVLPDNSDNGKGGAGGLGDLTGDLAELGKFNLKPVEKGFESLYDTLYKLGKRINEVFKDLLQGIDWDTAYDKARRFGKGFGEFLNGLLSDSETFYETGKFFANGVNLFAHALDAFHKEFDGFQLGVDIGSLVNGFTENLDWGVIQSAAIGKAHDLAQTINGAFLTIKWNDVGRTIGEGLNTAIDYFYTLGKEIKWSVIGTSIAEGINGLFRTFDFVQAAETLNYWAKGLLDALINALDKTDWRKVGKSIGEFISRIDVLEIAGKVVHALWEALNGAFSAWGGVFETAPIETALATALALPFSNRRFFSQYMRRPVLQWTQRLGTELATDLNKVFNGSIFRTFGDAFRGTEVGLDPFGNLTSSGTLQGISNGFNAVSKSLSNTTKAVGGLAVGFGELFMVKDSVYELVHGTDDIAGNIVKLTGSVGAAGVAFSALLGVPAGIIAMGAAGAVGAIMGITNAMKDLEEENAIAAITKDMGEAYGTLEDLTQKYKDVTENITGGLNSLHNDYVKVQELNGQLNNLVGGYGLVVSAIEGGNQLTGKAMEELIGNIQDVKKAWEDYINSQYAYLIQSTINDYQFAKQQGVLTDEMEKEYQDRINSLTGAREQEVEELNRVIEDLRKANDYYDAVMSQGVSGSTKEFAEKQLGNATKAVLEFGAATGAIADGSLKEFDDGLRELEGMKFDLSNVDFSNVEAGLTELEGHLSQIQERYANQKELLEKTITDRMAADPKLTREQAEKDVQMYYDALNEATQAAMDSYQFSLYDILTSNMKDGDRQSYVVAHNINEEFIKPLMGQMTEMYQQAANGEKPKLEDIIFNLFKDTWSKGSFFDGGAVFKDVEKNVKKYGEQLDSVKKSGKDMVTELKPAEDSMIGISNSAETSANSLGNVARIMGDFRDKSYLAFNGFSDFNKALLETGKSGESIKSVSDNMALVKNTLGQFGTALLPVKTGFVDFTMQTQAGMTVMTQVFGQSFNNIMKYGNQTISWMKGSFVPMFSGSYWQSLTASIPNAFGNAFRQAINIMTEMWKSFASWANENMKINANVTKNGNGATAKVNIPQYSAGGFPEDGFFYANHSEMVGKFANGQTAVANNEQIIEGIRQGVYEAVVSAMQGSNGNVTVELMGDAADIFTAVVRENNRSIMRTGASPIRV